MFYYLGRKKRVASQYPEPAFATIVEPFAGSAAYALHGDRWKLRVVINDLNPDVVGVWRYLQAASAKDILALPDFQHRDRLSDVASLTEDERWLIAFHINPGANQRSDVVTKFNRWAAGKRYIAANLHKIKHWEIRCGEFHELEDLEATWFVDPPYQATGKYYTTNTVTDYDALREWALARRGQMIVCERAGATWLPFKPLGKPIDICGKKKTQEVVYLREEMDEAGAQTGEPCPGCGAMMSAVGPVAWRCDGCGSRVRYLPLDLPPEDAEEETRSTMESHYPELIISGCQTGSDRGALIAAMKLGYRTGGWVPKGRLAEDGVVPPEFHVEEADSADYTRRTQLNVECADATILLTYEDPPTSGSALTMKLMKAEKQTGYHMVLERDASAALNRKAATELRRWLARVQPKTLNVAGPRESKAPGVQKHVTTVMLLTLQKPSRCVCGREIPDAIWEPSSPARTQGKPVRCSQCGHTTRWSDFDVNPEPIAPPF